MNLMTKRPEWLFRALGLNDPTLPQYLATDQVVPVVELSQGGWAHATFQQVRVESSMAGGIILGGSAHPVMAGGLQVRDDETCVILHYSLHNSSAGALVHQPFIVKGAPVPPLAERLTLSSFSVAAAQTHPQGAQLAAMAALAQMLPLVIPPTFALGENSGGVGLFVSLTVARFPAGVKPV